MENVINSLFPAPVYQAHRDFILDSTEEKEIADIIKEGLRKDGVLDHHTVDTYLFDTKLKNLKEFCEQHIKNYVKEITVPKNEELDFYITQSWLNVVKPGGSIRQHNHENSIISGAYYVSTVEDDRIVFNDPKSFMDLIRIEPKEFNIWNSPTWFIPVNNNLLLLFPSWLSHTVEQNEKATTDRISISFNTFVKGTIGKKYDLNVLNL